MASRKHVYMWVIYVRPISGHLYRAGQPEHNFWPLTDVHGSAVGFNTKAAAAPALYEARQMRGRRNAYLQKVGPWS